MSTIRFVGDTHGKFRRYREIIRDCPRSIQLGDMGVGFINYGGSRHGAFSQNPPFDAMAEGNHKFIRGNHDCCDSTTECLTQRGWLKYNEINQNDEILSLDDNMRPIWSKINNIVTFPYAGNMVRIESLRFSMSVTPNHRILIAKRHWKTRAYALAFQSADTLCGSFKIPVAGEFKLPDVDISDEMISLTGWLLTDGGYDKTNDTISIYQSKVEGQLEIERLLKALDISYRKNIRNRHIKEVCGRTLLKEGLPETSYYIHSHSRKRINEWIKLTVKEHRELPKWAMSLSNRQFQILLDAIVAGDGSWDGTNPSRKSCCVIYGPKKLLDSIQAAAVCHGWRVRFAIDNRGDYRLCLTRKSIFYVDKPKLFLEPYNGIVWCLKVPHENFMVRRKGCAYFTGNSPSVCKRHKFWIPDGTVEDNMMFIGGAVSIDRQWRVRGYSWWHDEEPSIAELLTMVDVYKMTKPEIMVTHEVPESVARIMCEASGSPKFDDGSRCRQAFQSMFEMHNPKLWLAGHWHRSFDRVINGTRFIVLNELEWMDINTTTFEIINKGNG